jgi:hypothetical protein
MKALLTCTAMIEAGAGVALLGFPALAAVLLLGAPLDAIAATIARIGGAALLTLGVACWVARGDAQSAAPRGIVAAMIVYNIGAVAILGAAGFRARPVDIVLWPAVALHAAMTVWCVMRLSSEDEVAEI